jgi:hypothetical protein
MSKKFEATYHHKLQFNRVVKIFVLENMMFLYAILAYQNILYLEMKFPTKYMYVGIVKHMCVENRA